MKMNAVETAVMNNPVRRAIQRHYETRLLLALGGAVPGARALEIGCGQGYGIELILERFRAAHVDAVDLDERMVARARGRVAGRAGVGRVVVGDATDLRAALRSPDGSYDAVFDFGILHHIPDWPAAVAEVARVLRPGGRFFFEEVTAHALDRPLYRVLFDHPRQDRFTDRELIAELEEHGLHVGDRYRRRFFGDFVLGVAEAARAGTNGPG
jgi:SAM-dependent methyltransferase